MPFRSLAAALLALLAACTQEPTLLGRGRDKERPTEPGYDIGFVWDRRDGFGAGDASGALGLAAQVDAHGNAAWAYRYVTDDPALALETWFDAPGTPLTWDESWYGRDYGSWSFADDQLPEINAHGFIHAVGAAAAFVPLVVWENPTQYTIDVHIGCRLTVMWMSQNSSDGPVIFNPPGSQPARLVVVHRTNGLLSTVLSDHVLEPTTEHPEVTLDVWATLSPVDEIAWSVRSSGDAGWVYVLDDCSLELLAKR